MSKPITGTVETQLHGFAHRFELRDRGFEHIVEAVFLLLVDGELLHLGTELAISRVRMSSSRDLISKQEAYTSAKEIYMNPSHPSTKQFQWVDRYPWADLLQAR